MFMLVLRLSRRLRTPLAALAFLGFALTAAASWELVWSDEFDVDGPPDPQKWGYDLGGGGWGNNERQTYTDDLQNARVENGNLLIQVHQVPGGRSPAYTSARLTTRERFATTYGHIEVRAQVPRETGTWAAIWMLASDALLSPTYWPDNGEIDIMEHVGYEIDPLFLEAIGEEQLPNLHATLHTARRNHLTSAGLGGSMYLPSAPDQFHTYAVTWYPDRMDFSVDGVIFYTINPTLAGVSRRNPPDDISPWWPFTQRFHLLLNIAVGGNWGGHFHTGFYPDSPYGADGIDHDGDWPQTMTVDYVRVYALPDWERHAVPGALAVDAYETEYGLILEPNDASPSGLAWTEVDGGDQATYSFYAAATSTYNAVVPVRTNGGGHQLRLVRNGAADNDLLIDLPDTGGAWQEVGVALPLTGGLNQVRLEAVSSGFGWGDLTLALPEAGDWFGFPQFAADVVATGSWLGPINVRYAPFLYVARTDSWFYSHHLAGGSFTGESQFIYAYNPVSLGVDSAAAAPWFYSHYLRKWFYVAGATTLADLAAEQWIFLLNQS